MLEISNKKTSYLSRSCSQTMIFDNKRFYVLCRLSTTALVSNVSDSRIEIRNNKLRFMRRHLLLWYKRLPDISNNTSKTTLPQVGNYCLRRR